eukprot:Tbor_TRINITY_DN5382_c6_g2::TRINITY_DN5382_c6_g2_i1::g.4264::m.4264
MRLNIRPTVARTPQRYIPHQYRNISAASITTTLGHPNNTINTNNNDNDNNNNNPPTSITKSPHIVVYTKYPYLPKGLCGLATPDSDASVESLAEAYTTLSLPDLVTLHRAISARYAGNNNNNNSTTPLGIKEYEQIILQRMGGGGGGTMGAIPSASPKAVDDTAAAEATTDTAPKKKTVEKNAFDVKVGKYPPANKIKLIKELRVVTQLPLGEAKGCIDKAPGIIIQNITKDDAEKIKSLLESHGAEVELL